MYIRRDKSHLHFGRQRRGPSRGLIVLLALVLAAGGLAIWQSDRILGEVQTLLGEPPTPTLTAATLAREAYNHYVNGDLAEAEAGYANALALEPDNADMLAEYTHILMLQNKGEEGLDAADRLVELAPGDPRGKALRVLGLYQQDRLDEALSYGLGVLEMHPTYAQTYAYLAWVYADLGRWMQAVEIGERGVELDPDSVDTFRAYAYALTWIGARDDAAKALERAIELHPTLDFLYFEIAEKYRALENVPAAIEAYEQVLAIRPTNTRALLRLCETYFNLREDTRAQEYCEQALAINPAYAEAWRQVGLVYYQQSEYQRAVDAFENCVEHGSDSIYCLYVRGLAYYYLDRCDLAVPILQESMALTQSDRILGFIREGLRLCDADPNLYDILPTEAPEEEQASDG
ncbi:MAG: tetratricopeptide repeat protein [Anaerolineae bacterium]|nr:tetratricopeptide repeat protein [Anaerolineae bacterium]